MRFSSQKQSREITNSQLKFTKFLWNIKALHLSHTNITCSSAQDFPYKINE